MLEYLVRTQALEGGGAPLPPQPVLSPRAAGGGRGGVSKQRGAAQATAAAVASARSHHRVSPRSSSSPRARQHNDDGGGGGGGRPLSPLLLGPLKGAASSPPPAARLRPRPKAITPIDDSKVSGVRRRPREVAPLEQATTGAFRHLFSMTEAAPQRAPAPVSDVPTHRRQPLSQAHAPLRETTGTETYARSLPGPVSKAPSRTKPTALRDGLAPAPFKSTGSLFSASDLRNLLGGRGPGTPGSPDSGPN